MMSSNWRSCAAVALAAVCLPVISLSLEEDAQSAVDRATALGVQTVSNQTQEDGGAAGAVESRLEAVTRELMDEMRGLRTVLQSRAADVNRTTLQEVLNVMGAVAASQHQTAVEMRAVKAEMGQLRRLVTAGISRRTDDSRLKSSVREIRDDIGDVKDAVLTTETGGSKLEEILGEFERVRRQLDEWNGTDCGCVGVKSTTASPRDHSTTQSAQDARVQALACTCLVCLLYTAATAATTHLKLLLRKTQHFPQHRC